ncbi:MAG: PH domain-containing protein [Pseudonocardiaceae bacterium]
MTGDNAAVTGSSTVTFRPPLTSLIAVWGLTVCLTPVAFGVPGLQVLYLGPVAIAVWLLRTRTVAGPETIMTRQVLGARSMTWSDVEGLRMDERSRVWAVLRGGEEIRLPAVRARDLPALSSASRGRLPNPLATRPT